MAIVVKDRVKETTATTGTGTLTLAGAVDNFISFSAIGDGNQTYYAIIDDANSDWEVGVGTYTASGTTLSRDTILGSSNAGSAVNLSAGDKNVFCTFPANKTHQGTGLVEHTNSIAEDYTIQDGNNAISGGAIDIEAGVTVTIPTGSTWTVV